MWKALFGGPKKSGKEGHIFIRFDTPGYNTDKEVDRLHFHDGQQLKDVIDEVKVSLTTLGRQDIISKCTLNHQQFGEIPLNDLDHAFRFITLKQLGFNLGGRKIEFVCYLTKEAVASQPRQGAAQNTRGAVGGRRQYGQGTADDNNAGGAAPSSAMKFDPRGTSDQNNAGGAAPGSATRFAPHGTSDENRGPGADNYAGAGRPATPEADDNLDPDMMQGALESIFMMDDPWSALDAKLLELKESRNFFQKIGLIGDTKVKTLQGYLEREEITAEHWQELPRFVLLTLRVSESSLTYLKILSGTLVKVLRKVGTKRFDFPHKWCPHGPSGGFSAQNEQTRDALRKHCREFLATAKPEHFRGNGGADLRSFTFLVGLLMGDFSASFTDLLADEHYLEWLLGWADVLKTTVSWPLDWFSTLVRLNPDLAETPVALAKIMNACSPLLLSSDAVDYLQQGLGRAANRVSDRAFFEEWLQLIRIAEGAEQIFETSQPLQRYRLIKRITLPRPHQELLRGQEIFARPSEVKPNEMRIVVTKDGKQSAWTVGKDFFELCTPGPILNMRIALWNIVFSSHQESLFDDFSAEAKNPAWGARLAKGILPDLASEQVIRSITDLVQLKPILIELISLGQDVCPPETAALLFKAIIRVLRDDTALDLVASVAEALDFAGFILSEFPQVRGINYIHPFVKICRMNFVCPQLQPRAVRAARAPQPQPRAVRALSVLLRSPSYVRALSEHPITRASYGFWMQADLGATSDELRQLHELEGRLDEKLIPFYVEILHSLDSPDLAIVNLEMIQNWKLVQNANFPLFGKVVGARLSSAVLQLCERLDDSNDPAEGPRDVEAYFELQAFCRPMLYMNDSLFPEVAKTFAALREKASFYRTLMVRQEMLGLKQAQSLRPYLCRSLQLVQFSKDEDALSPDDEDLVFNFTAALSSLETADAEFTDLQRTVDVIADFNQGSGMGFSAGDGRDKFPGWALDKYEEKNKELRALIDDSCGEANARLLVSLNSAEMLRQNHHKTDHLDLFRMLMTSELGSRRHFSGSESDDSESDSSSESDDDNYDDQPVSSMGGKNRQIFKASLDATVRGVRLLAELDEGLELSWLGRVLKIVGDRQLDVTWVAAQIVALDARVAASLAAEPSPVAPKRNLTRKEKMEQAQRAEEEAEKHNIKKVRILSLIDQYAAVSKATRRVEALRSVLNRLGLAPTESEWTEFERAALEVHDDEHLQTVGDVLKRKTSDTGKIGVSMETLEFFEVADSDLVCGLISYLVQRCRADQRGIDGFKQKAGFLRTNLVSKDVESRLLALTLELVKWFEPFVTAFENRTSDSRWIFNLCEHLQENEIGKSREAGDKFHANMQVIQECSSQIATIKRILTTDSSGKLEKAKDITTKGRVQIRVPKTPLEAPLALILVERSEYSEDDLRELLRWLSVFRPDAKGEFENLVDGLARLAQKLHEMRKAGHPFLEELNVGNPLSPVDTFESAVAEILPSDDRGDLCTSLAAKLFDWQQMIDGALKEMPRLRLLNRPELGEILRIVSRSQEGVVDEAETLQALLPFVSACSDLESKTPDSSKIEGAVGEFWAAKAADSTPADALQSVVAGFRAIFADQKFEGASLGNEVKVVHAFDQNKRRSYDAGELQAVLTMSGSCIPSLSQVFYCDGDNTSASARSTWDALLSFLQLPLAFPNCGRVFALVAPESLAMSDRSNLMRELEVWKAEKRKHADLLLVIRSAQGIDEFRAFDSSASDAAEPDAFQKAAHAARQRSLAAGIRSVKTFFGASGCGKTTAARFELTHRQGVAEENILRVTLSDDASASAVVRRLKSFVGARQKLGIHFDISGYAPCTTLHEILSDMLMTGVVRDRFSGAAFGFREGSEVHVVLDFGCVATGELDPYDILGNIVGRSYSPLFDLQSPLGRKATDLYVQSSNSEQGPVSEFGIPTDSFQLECLRDFALPVLMLFNDNVGRWESLFNYSLHMPLLPTVLKWHSLFLNERLREASIPRNWDRGFPLQEFREFKEVIDHVELAAQDEKQSLCDLRKRLGRTNISLRRFSLLCHSLHRRLQWLQLTLVPILAHSPLSPFQPGSLLDSLHEYYKEMVEEATEIACQQERRGQVFLYHEYDNFMLESIFGEDNAPEIAYQRSILAEEGLISNLIAGLGYAAGLPDDATADVHALVNRDLKVVITPDVVKKVGMIFELMQAGVSLIWSGDTGVGKTKVVEIAAALVNLRARPDIARTLRNGLEQVTKSADFDATLREVYLSSDGDIIKGVKRLVKVCTEGFEGDELQQQKSAAAFQMLAPRVVEILRKLAEEHKFLLPSLEERSQAGILQRLMDANFEQPEEYDGNLKLAREQGTAIQNYVLQDFKALEDVVSTFLGLGSRGLHTRLLINKKTSAAEFRQQILSFASAAKELKRELADHPVKDAGQYLVFLDELNTCTGLMGVAKEVLVDHRLDGEMLPENLHFVAAINPAQNLHIRPNVHYDFRGFDETSANAGSEGPREFLVRELDPSVQELVVDLNDFVQADFATRALADDTNGPRDPGKIDMANGDAIEHFLDVLFSERSERDDIPRNKFHRADLRRAISFGLRFLHSANIARVHPSIRDVMRVVHLYNYFLDPAHPASWDGETLRLKMEALGENDFGNNEIDLDIFCGAKLTGAQLRRMPKDAIVEKLKASGINDLERASHIADTLLVEESGGLAMMQDLALSEGSPARRWRNQDDCDRLHWLALIHAMSLCFYLRLESVGENPTSKEVWTRAAFVEAFQKEVLGGGALADSFPSVLVHTMTALFRDADTNVHNDLVCTSAMIEHLFSITCAVDSLLPLIMVGPAGVSKTLAFTVAMWNFESTEKGIFRKLCRCQVIRFQCTRGTTDNDIKDVYQRARDLQRVLDDVGGSSDRRRTRAVVQLEEAGLALEEHQPLKELHDHWDNPEVVTVMLSNVVLDAAKTNRCLQVLQAMAPTDELERLALGYLYPDDRLLRTEMDGAGADHRAIASALAKAFVRVSDRDLKLQCQEIDRHGRDRSSEASENRRALEQQSFTRDTRPGLYEARDFVFFLRFLRKHAATSGAAMVTPEILVEALQRQFGGLPHAAFRKVVEVFEEELYEVIKFRWGPRDRASELAKVDQTLLRLRESLRARVDLENNEDPNVAPFRHILVIDPTSSGSALSMLRDEGNDLLAKNTEASKHTEFVRLGDFPEDRTERAELECVLQIKQEMEHEKTIVMVNTGALNSLFYDVFNRHFQPVEGRYFANLGVGTHSENCFVDPNARFVLVVSMDELREMPLPFLSRFEKYILAPHLLLEPELKRRNLGIHGAALDYCARDMVHRLHVRSRNMNLLCGFHGAKLDDELSSEARIKEGKREAVDSDANDDADAEELPLEVFDTPSSTISSLLLRAVYRTPFGAAEIAVPPPLRLGQSLERGKDEVEDDDDDEGGSYQEATGNLDANLGTFTWSRERMLPSARLLNWHLLQLATPEDIYLCKELPREYKREYLIRQEHFSAARVISEVHLSDNMEVDRKWVMFVREDLNLTRMVRQGGVSGCFVPELEASVHFWPLDGVRSLSECKERCKMPAGKSIMIVPVNMALVGPKACNDFMNTVDSMFGQRPAISIFLVLYFPSNALSGRSWKFPAVFLGGWDFICCDVFGIAAARRVGVDQKTTGLIQEALKDIGVTVEDDEAPGEKRSLVDPKVLVARAAGLTDIELNDADVVHTLDQLTWAALWRLSDPQKTPYHDTQSMKTRLRVLSMTKKLQGAKFYFGNHKDRFCELAKLFADNPELLKHVIAPFSEGWEAELTSKLRSASLDILNGQPGIPALMTCLSDSILTRLETRYIANAVLKLTSHAALPAVYRSLKNKDHFAEGVFELIKSPMNLLPAELTDAGLDRPLIIPPMPVALPANCREFEVSPFFDLLMVRCSHALQALQHKRVARRKLTSALQTHFPTLSALLVAVSSEKEQPRALSDEFVARRLQMRFPEAKHTKSWRRLFSAVIASLVRETEVKPFLAGLAFLDVHGDAKLNQLRMCFETLIKIGDFGAPSKETKQLLPAHLTAKNFTDILQRELVSQLWRLFQGALDQKTGGKAEDVDESIRIEEWISVFRCWRMRVPSRCELFDAVSGGDDAEGEKLLAQIDAMTVVFLALQSWSDDSARAISPQVAPLVRAFVKAIRESGFQVSVFLEFAAALLCEIPVENERNFICAVVEHSVGFSFNHVIPDGAGEDVIRRAIVSSSTFSDLAHILAIRPKHGVVQHDIEKWEHVDVSSLAIEYSEFILPDIRVAVDRIARHDPKKEFVFAFDFRTLSHLEEPLTQILRAIPPGEEYAAPFGRLHLNEHAEKDLAQLAEDTKWKFAPPEENCFSALEWLLFWSFHDAEIDWLQANVGGAGAADHKIDVILRHLAFAAKFADSTRDATARPRERIMAAILLSAMEAVFLKSVGETAGSWDGINGKAKFRQELERLISDQVRSASFILRHFPDSATSSVLQDRKQLEFAGLERLHIDTAAIESGISGRADAGSPFSVFRFQLDGSPHGTAGTEDGDCCVALREVYSAVLADIEADGIFELRNLQAAGGPSLDTGASVRFSLLLALFHSPTVGWKAPDSAKAAARREEIRAVVASQRAEQWFGASAETDLAYSFVCRGPRAPRADGDVDNCARYLFTDSAMGDADAWTYASLLISILAVAVGAPDHGDDALGTFVSGTPFNLKRFLNPMCCMPGSTNGELFDCYYKVDLFDGRLDIYPANVFGDRRAFRLVANALTWSGPLWGALLHDEDNPENGTWLQTQEAFGHHFMNYMPQEHKDNPHGWYRGRGGQRNTRNPSQNDLAISYMFQRTFGFFNLLRGNAEIGGAGMSAEHFLSEVLLRLWFEATKTVGARLTGSRWANAAALRNYEAQLEARVLGPALASLKDTRGEYLAAQARAHARLGIIASLRDSDSEFTNSLRLPFERFQAVSASHPDFADAHLLKTFLAMRMEFDSVPTFDAVLRFATLSVQNLSGRFTKDQLGQPVEAVLDLLREQGESSANVDALRKAWHELCQAWPVFKRFLQKIQADAFARFKAAKEQTAEKATVDGDDDDDGPAEFGRLNNCGEIEIAEVSNDTPLLELLPVNGTQYNGGILWDAIRSTATYWQEYLLGLGNRFTFSDGILRAAKLEKMEEEAITVSDMLCGVNRSFFLVGADKRPGSLVRAVRASLRNESAAPDFRWRTSKIDIDLNRVQTALFDRFLSGRPLFSSKESDISTAFSVRQVGVDYVEETGDDKKEQGTTSTGTLPRSLRELSSLVKNLHPSNYGDPDALRQPEVSLVIQHLKNDVEYIKASAILLHVVVERVLLASSSGSPSTDAMRSAETAIGSVDEVEDGEKQQEAGTFALDTPLGKLLEHKHESFDRAVADATVKREVLEAVALKLDRVPLNCLKPLVTQILKEAVFVQELGDQARGFLSKDYNAQAEDELQEPLFALRDEIVNSSKRDKARFLRAADELRDFFQSAKASKRLLSSKSDDDMFAILLGMLPTSTAELCGRLAAFHPKVCNFPSVIQWLFSTTVEVREQIEAYDSANDVNLFEYIERFPSGTFGDEDVAPARELVRQNVAGPSPLATQRDPFYDENFSICVRGLVIKVDAAGAADHGPDSVIPLIQCLAGFDLVRTLVSSGDDLSPSKQAPHPRSHWVALVVSELLSVTERPRCLENSNIRPDVERSPPAQILTASADSQALSLRPFENLRADLRRDKRLSGDDLQNPQSCLAALLDDVDPNAVLDRLRHTFSGDQTELGCLWALDFHGVEESLEEALGRSVLQIHPPAAPNLQSGLAFSILTGTDRTVVRLPQRFKLPADRCTDSQSFSVTCGLRSVLLRSERGRFVVLVRSMREKGWVEIDDGRCVALDADVTIDEVLDDMQTGSAEHLQPVMAFYEVSSKKRKTTSLGVSGVAMAQDDAQGVIRDSPAWRKKQPADGSMEQPEGAEAPLAAEDAPAVPRWLLASASTVVGFAILAKVLEMGAMNSVAALLVIVVLVLLLVQGTKK